jgi:hypothetical protein
MDCAKRGCRRSEGSNCVGEESHIFQLPHRDRGQLFAAVDNKGSRQEHARVEADRRKEKHPLRR